MAKQDRNNALSRLAETMALDAVLLTAPANLYYFTGFRTTLYTRFNALIQARGSGPALVTSYVDEGLAKQGIWGRVWVRDIRIHGPISRADVFQNHLDTIRPELSRAKRVGVDAIPLTSYLELTREFPHLEIAEISTELNGLRRRKDPEEIDAIRQASRIGLQCLEKGREILGRPGTTEQDLGAELEYLARKLGADGQGYPILISSGEKILAPHAPPAPIEIPPDIPFVRIAFAPTFNGYCTSLIRTYARRPTTKEMRRYADAFFGAMTAIESMLKPGASVQDILETVGRSYEGVKLRDRWGGDMGYSLGITVHEPPRIGGTDTTKLEAGMTLAIMPGLRKATEATFHHSDVYQVTESGCECLSKGLQGIIEYG